MILFLKCECDPAYCKAEGCSHRDIWKFNGEEYYSQEDVVREAESYIGLLWGPVPNLLKFIEREK